MEEDYLDEVPAQKPRKEKGTGTEKQRKKSYAPAKVAAPIPKNRPPEVFCAPNRERTEYIISSIKSGMSSRFLQLISRMDESRMSIEIPMNHPLSYQLVIGDIAYLQDGALTDIVERKNLLARYKWDGDRYSLFQRKRQSIAANLDTLVIVASAKNPTFQPGFIDRYMVLAQECGIPPIICITKSDLKPISDPVLDWYEHTLGIRVFHTSSTTGAGIPELRDFIQNKTIAFVGKSGVGKSSLTNRLLEREATRVSGVSESDGQWRHTTTEATLYAWSNKSYIVDTPGIRSLDFLELSADDLVSYFSEFQKYTKDCEYQDCIHVNEPNCGIKTAVRDGDILDFRYQTYLRLRSEIR